MDAAFAKSRVTSAEQFFRGVVVYEDKRTRERALRLSDALLRRFWSDIEFNFSWWRFDYLGDPGLANDAREAAVRSDWILFSAHGGRELPLTVRNWIESWSNKRVNPAGALVALIGTEDDSLKGTTPIHIYLREVAQRAGLDYFSQVVETLAAKQDVSADEISLRADKLTSVLDDIIRRPTIPQRWGINE